MSVKNPPHQTSAHTLSTPKPCAHDTNAHNKREAQQTQSTQSTQSAPTKSPAHSSLNQPSTKTKPAYTQSPNKDNTDSTNTTDTAGTAQSPAKSAHSKPHSPHKALLLCLALLLACASISALVGNGSFGIPNTSILFDIRLPRILLAILVGCVLAGSGAVMQGMFKNALIDPFLLGISSGAAFGCALCIWLHDSSLLQVFAFGFGYLTILGVVGVSYLCQNSSMSLILAGVVLSAFLGAMSGFIKFFVEPQKAQTIVVWLLGSLNTAQWGDVWVALLGFCVGFLPLFCMRWRLNTLLLSDEQAISFGVPIVRLRIATLFCVSFAVALCVSVSGVIGWIGLVIPHIARFLFGADMRFLLPASLLLGGIGLTLADGIARNVAYFDIPVGIVTSLLGAPFFLFLLVRFGYVRG
ncbi:FecCD family ABC transporter permease [uncultured Helicobacter sp.]|uniref:FecCD family ABC transporter permease n=1 Tax=uncultured Helicobacter sp. TaxID=175537 RepID=UPI0037538417